MKDVMKAILFIGIFLILLFFVSKVFVLKGNSYGSDIISFYNEKRDDLDVIFFGSSHSYATFSPEIIKEVSGFNSYNFATQQQPIYITYHYMLEALKYQKPKIFVLEVKMLSVNQDYAGEGVVRDALDKMRMSLNKLKAINVSVDNQEDKLSYYFNIIKYHSRYSSLTLNDFKTGILNIGINNKGYKALEPNYELMVDNGEKILSQDTIELSDKNFEYFEKIIQLSKANDIKLILVKSPCLLNNDEQLYYNKVFEIANENNIDYIDYNQLFDELNLTYGDFYDVGHLSKFGSEKVSRHFAENCLNLN